MIEQKQADLVPAYRVSNQDGTPIDTKAQFFCLRLDEFNEDRKHLIACRVAVHAFAKEIETTYPSLATEIRTKFPLLTEHNFEVLQFKSLSKGSLYTRNTNRTYSTSGDAHQFSLTNLLSTPRLVTPVVIKRLSDGKVFQVGDIIVQQDATSKILYKKTKKKIEKFDYRATTGTLYVSTGISITDNLPLSNVAKVIFEPAVGELICEGEDYYGISSDKKIIKHTANRYSSAAVNGVFLKESDAQAKVKELELSEKKFSQADINDAVKKALDNYKGMQKFFDAGIYDGRNRLGQRTFSPYEQVYQPTLPQVTSSNEQSIYKSLPKTNRLFPQMESLQPFIADDGTEIKDFSDLVAWLSAAPKEGKTSSIPSNGIRQL